MITTTVILGLLYSSLLLYLISGITIPTKKLGAQSQKTTGFSVVVVFRNEANRLGPLLESIQALEYPRTHFELLFVDDQSTDNSVQMIHEALQKSELNYKVLNNKRSSNSPKKDGITLAVSQAKFPWIITTDADCSFGQQWLSCYQKLIATKEADMILGGVNLVFLKSTINTNWQWLEHLGLQQIAKSTVSKGKPILANGANLGYKKALFDQLSGFEGNTHIASGDDMFLLEKAIDKGFKIAGLYPSRARVDTPAETSFKGAINQRVRWAKKSSASKNKRLKIVGLLFGIANLWPLVLLGATILNLKFGLILIGYTVFKSIADFCFVNYKNPQSKTPNLLNSLLANLTYPYCLLLITLQSLRGGYTWKARSFKK